MIVGVRLRCDTCDVLWNGPAAGLCWCCQKPGARVATITSAGRTGPMSGLFARAMAAAQQQYDASHVRGAP